MKRFFLVLCLQTYSVSAGPHCHISSDEVDTVLSTTDMNDEQKEFLGEFSEEFLDDINLVDESELQEVTSKADASLVDRMAHHIKRAGIVCVLQMHYAREWLTKKIEQIRA